MNPDAPVVAAQLGRPPRGRWRVVARCALGAPQVIAVAPRLDDGSPFPTTFWLTCPRLVESVHALESAGQSARFAQAAASDPALAAALTTADAAYRAARTAEGAGDDPCESVGVAGQADALAVKCLHARLAARLAGVPDPIGAEVAGMLPAQPCDSRADERCIVRDPAGC